MKSAARVLVAAFILAVVASGALVMATSSPTADLPQTWPSGRGPTTSPPTTPRPSPTYDGSRPCATAPTYRVRSTLFGESTNAGIHGLAAGVAAANHSFGDHSVLRLYDPGPPAPDEWALRAPVIGDRRAGLVTSFRIPPRQVIGGSYDARLREYFLTAPRGYPIFWSYYHEPEAPIQDGRFSAHQFIRAFRHIARIAARTCRSNLYPTLILTGYTATLASRRDWRTYYPGDPYVSVVAWDPYNGVHRRPTHYRSPRELYAACEADAASVGKPWGVAETGSALVPGDGGQGRAAWITEVGSYLRRHRAAFALYYNSRFRIDFRLTDPASAHAWRRLTEG